MSMVGTRDTAESKGLRHEISSTEGGLKGKDQQGQVNTEHLYIYDYNMYICITIFKVETDLT